MSSPQTNESETKEDAVVRRTSDIIKSKSDDREYRLITLANKMDIMLVSDPETEQFGISIIKQTLQTNSNTSLHDTSIFQSAACSVAVRIGHFADPDEIPGLAHFLEHVCFIYILFISKHFMLYYHIK